MEHDELERQGHVQRHGQLLHQRVEQRLDQYLDHARQYQRGASGQQRAALRFRRVVVRQRHFASPRSRNERLSAYFAGLVPNRRTLLLAIPVVLFFPVLLIVGNAIAKLLGNDFAKPLYLQMPVSVWLPVMTIKLFTVAMLTGGNEEHGWRGVLQPLLQKATNPLVATLIIGVI